MRTPEQPRIKFRITRQESPLITPLENFRPEFRRTRLAKPSIPDEAPEKRETPDFPDFMPTRIPVTPEPAKTPREPVPVKR